MKFLKQLLITTMLATLLATPCAAELTGTGGLEIDASEIDDQLKINITSRPMHGTRGILISALYDYTGLNEEIVHHRELGYHWGGWTTRCLVYKFGAYHIFITNHAYTEKRMIDHANVYIGSPPISYNAVMLLLNEQTTTLTVIIDMSDYPDLNLLYRGETDRIACRNRIRLIDTFVPDVRKDGEQIISSDTPFISRTVAGKIVTVVYENPGLTVGDICTVAAGSIGNQLLLSQRTAVPVCAENAQTVGSDADPAEPVGTDDYHAETVEVHDEHEEAL
ncbi:MAG: hypothetical protein LBJ95_02100 [Oscillospiraceae bacterium]|jgi:hypothetical protein|nr:hypothetical protein [Oscillospiraceae bacterium]